MKNKLLFIIFLFCGIYAIAQNKKINLNEREKIEIESTARFRDQNEPLKATRTRAFTLSKTLQSNLDVSIKDVLELDLFTDRKYKAYIDKIEKDVNGTLSIRARMLDYPMGYCIITTSSDKRSLVVINIPELNEKYISELDARTKKSYLLELDKNQPDNLECGGSMIPPSESENTEINTREGESKQKIQALNLGVNDPAVIDIMLVYTPAAKKHRENSGGINTSIATMMATSNLVLDNSQVGITLNLVHSREINYTETDSHKTDLERLKDKTDGYMDEVHQWRDEYEADLVVFIRGGYNGGFGGSGGGLAYLLKYPQGVPSLGFSLIGVASLSGTSPIHEIGHNMGVGHHKQQVVSPGPGLFPYSSGWRWKGTDDKMYNCIMTYGINDGINSRTVPYFSNPNINYAGAPTGHPTEGDGARTLKEIKHIVAAYRGSCTVPTGLTSNNLTSKGATLSWATVIGAQSYTLEYKVSTASEWAPSVSTTGITHTLSGLTAGTAYQWRVKSNCATGDSSGYTQGNFSTLVVCTAPTGLTSNNLTSKGATLSWATVIGAQSYTLEYKVSTASEWAPSVSTTGITHTLSGLTAGTIYSWRVKANCLTGGSSEYTEGNFTTLAVCTVPIGLNTSSIAINSAKLSWSLVSGDLTYTVEYKASTATSWTPAVTTTGITHTLPELTTNTAYNWRVKANCAIGNSSEYATTNFTTAEQEQISYKLEVGEDIKMRDILCGGLQTGAEFLLKNTGNTDFNGYITMALTDDKDNFKYDLASPNVLRPIKSNSSLSYGSAIHHPVDVIPGTYRFRIMYKENISDQWKALTEGSYSTYQEMKIEDCYGKDAKLELARGLSSTVTSPKAGSKFTTSVAIKNAGTKRFRWALYNSFNRSQ